jgi:molybdopterin synthase sulfur carrier subunit
MGRARPMATVYHVAEVWLPPSDVRATCCGMEPSPRSVRILYFGALGERAGLSQERLDLGPEETRIADVRRQIQVRHPSLDGCLGSVRVARNQAFCGDDEPVAHDDEIAFLPPLAGG